jgi:hypothetical protein
MILGVAVIACNLSGCAPAIPSGPAAQPYVRSSAISSPRSDAPIRKVAASELGPEVAASMPEIVREQPTPSDQGAQAMVDSMLAAVERKNGVATISLDPLRNQSRTAAGEFESFRERLAELLSTAGEKSGLRFTSDSSDAGIADYELQGAAYLATVEGIDMWELYINLSPTKNHWSIWQSNGPVRVLRRPRANQTQIFIN